MRRIVMINWISLDGLFAGPNGEIDWIIRDPEVDKALHEPRAGEASSVGSDTMLLGNITYTMFENSWPQIAKDPNAPEELHKLADEVIGMTKLVFSRTRNEVPWENSKLFHSNLVEEVEKLKRGKGTDIIVFGSGTIVQQLTNAGLIDEYLIAITPVMLGKGKPLFADVKRLNLRLLETRTFRSGNVLLRYELAS
ncbi:MAG: dihydrofolate reductase [Chloroflexi bacterium]|nr:MAG: dihydrofolate reductase [Chloroflexota bacterium]RPI96022.1 MAG: dihydrofolate reductase [Chloroflexota bacterium]